MKKPLTNIRKNSAKHPVVWGAVVLLLGSGTELLMTQRLLGTAAIDYVMRKIGAGSLGVLPTFLIQELTLFVGLIIIAVAVHIIVRAGFSKEGKYLDLLSFFFFIGGIVGVVSTFLSKLTQSGAAEPIVLYVIPILSLLLYVGAIREVYKIPVAQAAVSGLVPIIFAIVIFAV